MSFISNVKLSVYTPNTQSSPIVRRRDKLAFKVEEQLKLAVDSALWQQGAGVCQR